MEDYPREFSSEARAAVEAQIIRARQKYAHERQARDGSRWPDGATRVRSWILSVFLVYARQTIGIGAQGIWSVDKVRSKALEGLRRITIMVVHDVGFGSWISNTTGSITSDAMRAFESTPEFKEFEDWLLALADAKGPDRNPHMYDEKLAHKILERLAEAFPGKLHLSQLQDLLPDQKTLPPQAWRSVIEALFLERKIDGQFVAGDLPFDYDAANLYITDFGRLQLRVRPAAGSASSRVAGEGNSDIPELPLKFQIAFDAARAKADLVSHEGASAIPSHPLVDLLRKPIRIQNIYFAYCSEARNAYREGCWTAAQVRHAVRAAWLSIFDSCFDEEYESATDAKKSESRSAVWKTVLDDHRWKQHLAELVEVAEKALQDPPSAKHVESDEAKTSGSESVESDAQPSMAGPSSGVQQPSLKVNSWEEPESVQRRQRVAGDMDAAYARCLGRNPPEAARQEELLRDAREHVAMQLNQALNELALPDGASEMDIEAALYSVRDKLALAVWEDLRPAHKNFSFCRLELREFKETIWNEGYPKPGDPSFMERAMLAVRESAVAQQTETPATDLAATPDNIVDTPATAFPSTVGRNIDKLRKECGWSFDDLAKTSGLGKKLILGHVKQGKGLHPRTLKTYADAFTKGLSRKVSVAEIEL